MRMTEERVGADPRDKVSRGTKAVKFLSMRVVMTLWVVMTLAVMGARGQTLTVLHNFTGHSEGNFPQAGVTMDRAGNFYGTTGFGGLGYGTVFKLSHVGSGWIMTTIYEFQGAQDGANPVARVVFGPDGTLYGTTPSGGNHQLGTVFNLRPPASICRTTQCPWTESVLYNFTGGADGSGPQYGDLVFDAAGNIYGTTAAGGGSCTEGSCGVVFKLSRGGQGWMESVAYSFTGGGDGAFPYSGVTFDGAGNLWGTTTGGGTYDSGGLYRLTPSGSHWLETTLHSFGGAGDGYDAFGGVVFDGQGNLYGTTYGGGYNGGGTVYELQPSGNDWNYSLICNLTEFDGPVDTPVLDAAGNLYVTSYISGEYLFGSVFKLTRGNGNWSYSDLHDFANGSDGGGPLGGVVLDTAGNLYGTTTLGGSGGEGVVYEIQQ
jgi:uncharacterized repeat protein (TIGR03803 family)